MKKMKRVAIANRGEVAVRIIRACEELGLETVLLHSDADIHSRAYRLATKTICIGPAVAALSYLNIDANIGAALAAGAPTQLRRIVMLLVDTCQGKDDGQMNRNVAAEYAVIRGTANNDVVGVLVVVLALR